jgi:DNA mismatch repair protein MutS
MINFKFSTENMQSLQEIISLIDSAIKVDANNLITGGGIIQDGFDNEIDELRNLVNHSHEWLNDYTQKLVLDT